ncbi:hypothetical protein DQR70_06190 [Salmonella enterica subsp. enterica serovar Oslo]|nr:hypothetical protein [Salmonella enterica subsp. enterica serovar Oslo]
MKPFLVLMLYIVLVGLLLMWLSDMQRSRDSYTGWNFKKFDAVRDLEHYFLLIPYIGGTLSALIIAPDYRLTILAGYLCLSLVLICYTYLVRWVALQGKIKSGTFITLITLSTLSYYGVTLITSLVYSGVM